MRPRARSHAVESLERLSRGQYVWFNDRTVPCEVVASGDVGLYNGSIFVEYLVILDGPAGAELWLERTGSGRIRVKESAPYGAYANVRPGTLRASV